MASDLIALRIFPLFLFGLQLLLIVCRPISGSRHINSCMPTKKLTSPLVLRCAANVREARLRLGLSQEELAEAANLHRTFVGSVERSERNITLESLEKLALGLRVDPSVLLATSPEK
jgi:ribosome-binding protein aMBF1 (putative translation factor)